MGLVTVAGFLLLVVLAGSIISYVNIMQIGRLRDQVLRLSDDLAALKRGLAGRGGAATTADDAAQSEETAPEPDGTALTPPVPEAPTLAATHRPPSVSEVRDATDRGAAASSQPPPESPPPADIPPLSAPPPPPSGAAMGFEDRLGSQLTVWIGGLSLALGGIFLVKYSIDSGLLGPAMRIFLGVVLAVVLGGLGEYARRTDIVDELAARAPKQFAGLPNAYVPGILTAAGLVTAFATAYAAYALYGFIGGFGAFLVLALISFAGLAVSVWHGPGLATVGLVGGYVTPALISTNAPSAWSLFTYLLILTAAVYLTAWFRNSLMLARLGCAGATLWAILWLLTTYRAGDALPLAIFVVALPVLALVLLRQDNEDEADPSAEDAPSAFGAPEIDWAVFDWPLLQILCVNAALGVLYVMLEGHGQLSSMTTGVIAAMFVAAATRWHRLLPLAAVAALTFSAHLATWPTVKVWNLPTLSAFEMISSGRFMTFAIFGAGALAVAGLWHTFVKKPHVIWGGIAAAVPVSAFAYTYLRVTELERSIPFAIAGLILGGIFGVIAERLDRVDVMSDVVVRDRAWTVGALAATTCGFIALALTINFERGWLTIGLAAVAPALAWISIKRPIPILRWLVAVFAAIVVARLIWDPRIVGEALGTTPVFNWILYGYGLPTVAFGAAAWFLMRDGDDLPAKIVRAAAMAFGATLIGMEIRHLMNGGNVYASRFGLAELATHTLSWLGFSFGLRWRSKKTRDGLMMQAANLVGLAGFASIALGHLVVQHPMVTRDTLAGGAIFNTLLLAYALPALLCGLIVWQMMSRSSEDAPAPAITGLPWTPRSFADAFRLAAGALALVLAFTYLTLEVSRLFQGPVLRFNPSDSELYTWSAVWIAFAVGLLYAGITLPSQHLRHAGFGVLLVATLKIFLIDMGALTGLLRALSFIGLGGALVGIGYAYQKLVLQSLAPPPDMEPPDDGEGEPESFQPT